ncbi:hypothetical protein OROMI_001028 [Orobanche minor]
MRGEDTNHKYFHASLKSRSKSGISLLVSTTGQRLNTELEIAKEVTDFFISLLGTTTVTSQAIDRQIIGLGPILNIEQRRALVSPVTAAEIWNGLQSIGDDKSPGADGYTARFYKKAWPVIGAELTSAVQDFFSSGRLLRSINTTVITLIPKSPTATTVKEYHPIACCTVIYKIISKVMTTRMSKVMDYLVGKEQAAFVPGRFIHDNTIMAQEIIRGYGRKNTSSRCMIKIDLQKAYDSISWLFVEDLLRGLGFPHQFVGWIITCLTTVSYQICLNGQVLELLKERRD